MAQALQLLMIDRMETMLERLKDERVIKQFYYRRQGISQAPEFPFAFFELGADQNYTLDQVDLKGNGGMKYTVESRITLTFVIKREATQAVKELAELEDILRRRILTDLQITEVDGNCRIVIRGMATAFDPLIAALFDEYAHATIAIDYSGYDDYNNNGGGVTHAAISVQGRWRGPGWASSSDQGPAGGDQPGTRRRT